MPFTSISEPNAITDRVIEISIRAGEEILHFYKTDFEFRKKSNNSPVTEADLAANEIILAGLKSLAPEIPVISEEVTVPEYAERSKWQYYWLIDPLDGTKSFLRGDDQFTVNIALIKGNYPVFGVVHSPIEQNTYWGVSGQGAYRFHGTDGERQSISVRPFARSPVTIIAPMTRTLGRVQIFRENLKAHSIESEILNSSSSIKFCRVAEGVADLYPNFGTTSEWDTAAAQCVVECAGGSVKDLHGNRVKYNKPDRKLHNPQFLVAGPDDIDWRRFLPVS